MDCGNLSILEVAGGQASEKRVVFLQKGIREAARGNTQQEEKLAGPQKNVQQAAALQIVDVFAVQSDIQSPPRTLLDECPQRGEIETHAAQLLAPGIDALQIVVAELDEVIQAKILLSQ